MKKITFLSIVSLFFVQIGHAQYKEYPKLSTLFTAAKFQECVDAAVKITTKEPKEFYPVLYCAKSYFELFKLSEEKGKYNHLKNSLKYASKIEKLDKNKSKEEEYSGFMHDLHQSLLDYAAKLYDGPQKDKSKALFENLAKIYQDTTEQYYSFYPEQRKKVPVLGVNTFDVKKNQTDSKGLKQGFWSKVYPNGNVAYEVNFKNNIPVGDYKRYHENGKLAIFIRYDDKGEWGDAQIFNDKSELIAEGKYHNKNKSGNWKYYFEKTLAAEDNFKEGKRDGVCRTFYKNGKVSDERIFTSDVENGVWRQYFPSGKIKLETRIDSGVRNSVYYVYHDNGHLETRGRYKKDQMDGEWIYYDRDGKEVQKINYVMGKADKQDELDVQENKIFMELEKNKNRLLDPADFIHNPDEYIRANSLKEK